MIKHQKELNKYSRLELLDLLIAQRKELERLENELALANAQLANRTLVCEKAGSLAQAALELNHVFESAQNAADQYLENIKSGGYKE